MSKEKDITLKELPDVMTFFDTEFADRRNSRVCQIGLMRVTSDFTVLQQDVMLVDPEKPFGKFQFRTHHIGPADVRGCITFGEAWDMVIGGYFPEGCAVVGHNVGVDLAVLDKCCLAYGIKMPAVRRADTMSIAKLVFPEMGSYKLNLVCEYAGLDMERFEREFHHDALHDTEATARAFFKMHRMRPECVKWRRRNPKHGLVDRRLTTEEAAGSSE